MPEIYRCTRDVELPEDNRGNRRRTREGDIASYIEDAHDGVMVLIDLYTTRQYVVDGIDHTSNTFTTEYVVIDRTLFEECFIPQREYHKRWLNSLFIE